MWVGNNNVKQKEYNLAWGKNVNLFPVFLCQSGEFMLGIYATFLRFCGQISPWPLRFQFNNFSADFWRSVLVKHPVIKIQRCSILWRQKTKNLPALYWQIVSWPWECLLQTPISFLDICHDWTKHNLCCHNKKLRDYPPNENRESMIYTLPQGLIVQLLLLASINIFEVQTILLGFQLHREKWVYSKVIFCIDSTIASSKPWLQRLQGFYN